MKSWIYIPSDCDLMKIDINTGNIVYPYDASHIICDSSDGEQIEQFKKFISEFKTLVKEHYENSQSNNWVPTEQDEVHWLTVTYPSWIGTAHHKGSTDSKDQINYPYNCYRTEEEVNQLLEKIKELIKKYGL